MHQNRKNTLIIKKSIINAVKDETAHLLEKIDYLYEMHKYRPKLSIIIRKAEEIIDALTSNSNKEINRILLTALERVTPYFLSIFEENFAEIDKYKVVKVLKNKASALRYIININVLFPTGDAEKHTAKFINEAKSGILQEINLFAQNLESIAKEKTNGERVELFETITKELVTNVSKKVCEIYRTIK